jgi:tetratricopeptide (TPR) repeat protein
LALNKIITYLVFTVLFFNSVSFCRAQSELKTDSLLKLLPQQKNDTATVNLFNVLAMEFRNSDPDTALWFAKKAIALSKQIRFENGQAEGLLWMGTAATTKGNYSEAIAALNNSIALFGKISNKKKDVKISRLLGRAYNNISNVYWYKGSFDLAIKNQFQSLKIRESINDKYGIASSYNNIGNIYCEQSKFEQALKYYTLSLVIKKKINDEKGIADSYNNIGLVHNYSKNYVAAIESYTRSLNKYKEINDIYGVAVVLNNLGMNYENQNRVDEAYEALNESLRLKKEIDDRYGTALTYLSLGVLDYRTKKFASSRNYFLSALAISKELASKTEIRDSYEGLTKLDSASNNMKGALENYKNYIAYRDSLNNEENIKKQTQIEMQYAFDKKQAADSVKNVERANLEEQKHQQKIQQQRIYAFLGVAGFVLMLVIALVSFRAYRQKQKANTLIEQQKQMVEEKQKEILDSIHYAKRIQQALLTSEKYIVRNIKRLRS